jgi:hypothetical protein
MNATKIAASPAPEHDPYDAEIAAAGPLRVTDADAAADRVWFANHPNRLFHARAGHDGVWLIFRRWQNEGPDLYLRTFSRTIEQPGDNDAAIAIGWYRAVYPDLPPAEVRKCVARVLRGSAP